MARMIRLRGDFNGLFGGMLCLSHTETCLDEQGNAVMLHAGMEVTAFEPDTEDGQPEELLASGIVQASPESLQCRGSKWVLIIDERGFRRKSDSN